MAESLQPDVHPNLPRRAVYWVDYGRALARLRGRHDHAVIVGAATPSFASAHRFDRHQPQLRRLVLGSHSGRALKVLRAAHHLVRTK